MSRLETFRLLTADSDYAMTPSCHVPAGATASLLTCQAAGREREILRGERRADIYRRYVLKFEHAFVALTKYLPFGKAN